MAESQGSWIGNLEPRLTCGVSQETSLFWLLWQCWRSGFRCAGFGVERKDGRVLDWTMLDMKQELHDSNGIDVLVEEKEKKELANELERTEEKDVSADFLSFVGEKELEEEADKLKEKEEKGDKETRRMYQQTSEALWEGGEDEEKVGKGRDM